MKCAIEELATNFDKSLFEMKLNFIYPPTKHDLIFNLEDIFTLLAKFSKLHI